jgi:hypothetical protein
MRPYADQSDLREALWRDLFAETGALLSDQASPAAYGLLLYPSRAPARPYYFLGLPAAALQGQPGALVLKRLSGGASACFDCSHSGQSLAFTQSYLFSTWLPHAPEISMPPFLIEQFALPALVSGARCWPTRILLPLNWSN